MLFAKQIPQIRKFINNPKDRIIDTNNVWALLEVETVVIETEDVAIESVFAVESLLLDVDGSLLS